MMLARIAGAAMGLDSRRLRQFASIALLGGLAACAPSEPGAPLDNVHWHAHPGSNERNPGILLEDYVSLRLPEAANARPDVGGGRPLLVLNLLADHYLYFRGNTWAFREPGTTATQRESGLIAIRNELKAHVDAPDGLAPYGPGRPSVILLADRATDWRDVRDLLFVLVEPPRSVCTLQIAVERWSPREDSRLEGDLVRTNGVAPEEAGSTLSVTLRARHEGDATVVDLDLAGRQWAFPHPRQVEDPFSDPEFLDLANRRWNDLASWLPTVTSGSREARIRIEGTGDVWPPFTYVVKGIDVLLGIGVRELTFVEEGLRWSLAEPQPYDATRYADAPLFPPALVGLCALAVLAAFLLTFPPLHRRRRARRAPTR